MCHKTFTMNWEVKMGRTRSYENWLTERLKDPEEAAAYLNACLEDEGEDEQEAVFLRAVRDVARAHGMANIAERAHLNRESLYKSLSAEGDPRLSTFRAVIKAIGLRICLQPERSEGPTDPRAAA
jgi:probable addiction module antidote protein